MARFRTIKPQFFTSEQVVACSTNARLLFVGMWCFCDDGGVHPASLARLKMEVYPADSFSVEQIAEWVEELKGAQLLESYLVEGKEFWRVTGWHHQKIEKPTYTYPRSAEFGEQSATVRRRLGESSPPERNGMERSRKERNGKDGCVEAGEPPATPNASDPNAYPVWPCVPGRNGGAETWRLSESLTATWTRTFPAVDVPAETLKAHAWVMANLTRRKTAGGMERFLYGWLSRAQNASGASAARSGGYSRKDYTP